MEKANVVQIIGIAWYQPEHYTRIQAVMEDGHALPANYAAWERLAHHLEEQARRNGQLTVRANIHPDEFLDWCRERGLNVNAKARIEFANSIAKKASRQGNVA